MDTLVQGYSSYINDLKYHHHSSIPAPPNQNHVKTTYELTHSNPNGLRAVDPSPGESSEGEEGDYFDGVLKYINQMLMEEEDLENKPCMFHECSALQAAEKSFYDVLGQKYPPNHETPDDSFTSQNNNMFESDWIQDQAEFDPFLGQSSIVDHTFQSPFDSPVSPFQVLDSSTKTQLITQSTADYYVNYGAQPKEETRNASRQKKTHYLEDTDYLQESRNTKQLASYEEDLVESAMYDKVLLCPVLNPDLHKDSQKKNKLQPKASSNVGRPRGGKKQGNKKEMVDLRGLLTQCAQSVATGNLRTVEELLKRIRQHSTPHGDDTERLSHYIANAMEARLAGMGTSLYSAFTTRKIMAADVLKAYQAYVTACPFHKMSNIFANKSIGKLARTATRLHIIDFGILYGFQWPCLIQGLSLRPGGPPRLRITGIDLPQPGFRPAERVEDTGKRLANYCKRFNVPFEYNAIAKKWETIKLEDLKIDRDEMLVVNSMYRLRNVPDETVLANSPRDSVLSFIKKINPDMFIHGVLNGTYNAPFFVTRFREALFHFSTLFDMFEATAPREDMNRLLFEQEVFARDAMNVVACEGTARIERPETYKQWQGRNVRAGFRQLPLYKDVVEEVSGKVRARYHKDFLVDEESNWMLQGWKGRVLYALSCWKPVHE